MIRVVVVDDHPVVLAGLTALIDADPSMAVTAVASSAGEAHSLELDSEPDVCVVDLQLPDGDGIGVGAALKQRWTTTRVLILTMASDSASVIRSLSAGLDGYLLKDSDPAELRAAIRSAAEGSVVLGRGASAPIVAAASSLPSSNPLAALDSRDREILAMMVQRMNPEQIARELFVSPKTIRNRISNIVSKLGVATRAEAVAIGLAGGITVPTDSR